MKKINCLDLSIQHQELKSEIFEAFEKVYDKTAFSGGFFVEQFEKDFSNFIGSKFTIGLSNGTVALHLAMLTLGIGEGDEVILPSNTFIATAWGISHVGAKPVFVDCDDTWNIDPTKIESAITSKTKAVIGVHLYGQPFDIDAVNLICKKHNLFLIEDAAQAQGAKYKGKPIGTFGEMACFSFYPGKNLGACGEGGGITTNSELYFNRLNSLRNHGSIVRYYHDEIGYNYRMSGLEAASLSVKLKYLERWNQARNNIAKMYREKIKNDKIIFQSIPNWAESVNHLFVVTTENKTSFVKHLDENGINAAFHYPVPCHLQKAYSFLDYKKGSLPKSEYLATHCVSLPMYPELTQDQINYIINVINKY